MISLYSDQELRLAIENAKRRRDAARRAKVHTGQMQAQETVDDLAQAEALYKRLSCEAAHRWGLLR